MLDATTHFDVLILGAGPGGIAAAVTACEAGKRVGVIDDAPFAGGQIWRNRGEVGKTKSARTWIGKLNSATNVEWLRQSRAVARLGPNTLLIETPAGPRRLTWEALVLATGARELFLPFPGWTLPGVVGAGGVQALMKAGLSVAGKRVVVAGSGPLLLAVADLLRSEGATVPMILEQAPAGRINRFGLSLVKTPGKLLAGVVLRGKLLGSRYTNDAYPVRVIPAVDGLRLVYHHRHGQASVKCDLLACGFGLIPNNEVAQSLGCRLNADGTVCVDGRLRTSVPGVFAVGELTGVGGVDKAIGEGRLAAYVIAGDEAAVASLAKSHAADLAFARRLDVAFALRPELFKLATPETIVCRCEDVPLSAVCRSISGRDAKLQVRCGMGPCQGRVCGPILQRLQGVEAPQVRPPVFATSIATLAAAGRPAEDA